MSDRIALANAIEGAGIERTGRRDHRMSRGIDQLIKAKILRDLGGRHREPDVADLMAEAIQLGRQRRREPEQPLPDVPLHKRGFGVMDDDAVH
jgi:hypothetical protein